MRIAVRLLTLIALMTLAPRAGAQRYDRGYDFSKNSDYLKKGTWMMGGTGNYSIHHNDDYQLLVVEGINSVGYRLNVSPAFCYMLKDNLGLGARVEYQRGMFKLDEASLNLGDAALDISNYHILSQKVITKAILRNYIPIGDSRRFAMFNETQLSFGFGQGKVLNGNGTYPQGSYDIITNFGLNLCPGLMAFADEHFAVEVTVNMLGLNISHVDQTHNQVYHGSRNSTSVNFRVNVLSVGVGLYYYL